MGTPFFGEILEPYTRALIDEDQCYQEYVKPELDIEGQFELPKQINKLLFIEAKNANECRFFNTYQPICRIVTAGVEILRLENSIYIIKWSPSKNITSGEVIQLFEEWLNLANHVYAITLSSVGIYQNYRMIEKPPSIVKMLTNEKHFWPYDKLEPPNLISDFAANVLSFCIHCRYKCALFIVYTDLLPHDSLNTGPLSDIFNHIKIPVSAFCEVKPVISANNLYM